MNVCHPLDTAGHLLQYLVNYSAVCPQLEALLDHMKLYYILSSIKRWREMKILRPQQAAQPLNGTNETKIFARYPRI